MDSIPLSQFLSPSPSQSSGTWLHFPVTHSRWLTYLAPVRADLPVGAQSELTGLCGLWGGQVGAALGVNHGGAVPEALSALQLPLLQSGATGHAAL